MSGKMNWWRSGKEHSGHLSVMDERELVDRDRASKWLARKESNQNSKSSESQKNQQRKRDWPSKKQIESARHTRAQLAKWGVPWPPPSGWKRALIDKDDLFFSFSTSETYQQLRTDLSLRGGDTIRALDNSSPLDPTRRR